MRSYRILTKAEEGHVSITSLKHLHR